MSVALTACQPTGTAPAARQGAVPVDAAAIVAQTLGRFAVNALVVPLLDDSEPPRFTLAALPLMCAEADDVTLDGAPLVEGAPVPAGAFVLQWRLRDTCPFGLQGPSLRGDVEVLVLRDGGGLQAQVRAPSRAVALLAEGAGRR